MASSPAEGIKVLTAAHVATSLWDVQIGVLPSEPDRTMMIMDTGGYTPNPKWLIDYPTVQTLIRGGVNDYQAVYNECRTIRDILLGIDPLTVNGDWWASITMQGDMVYIGRDENSRPMYSANYRLIIEPQLTGESNRTAL